jgi:hypothetical protein
LRRQQLQQFVGLGHKDAAARGRAVGSGRAAGPSFQFSGTPPAPLRQSISAASSPASLHRDSMYAADVSSSVPPWRDAARPGTAPPGWGQASSPGATLSAVSGLTDGRLAPSPPSRVGRGLVGSVLSVMSGGPGGEDAEGGAIKYGMPASFWGHSVRLGWSKLRKRRLIVSRRAPARRDVVLSPTTVVRDYSAARSGAGSAAATPPFVPRAQHPFVLPSQGGAAVWIRPQQQQQPRRSVFDQPPRMTTPFVSPLSTATAPSMQLLQQAATNLGTALAGAVNVGAAGALRRTDGSTISVTITCDPKGSTVNTSVQTPR